MDAATISLLIGGAVTVITALGTTAVLIINALRSVRTDVAKVATDVQAVKNQTDGLTKLAVKQAHAAGVIEGTKTERADSEAKAGMTGERA